LRQAERQAERARGRAATKGAMVRRGKAILVKLASSAQTGY